MRSAEEFAGDLVVGCSHSEMCLGAVAIKVRARDVEGEQLLTKEYADVECPWCAGRAQGYGPLFSPESGGYFHQHGETGRLIGCRAAGIWSLRASRSEAREKERAG